MGNNIPIKVNEIYTLDIINTGYSGEGIAKINEFTIFINGAIKGEKVQVKIIEVKKKFAFAELVNVMEKSPHRVDPICSIYNECGGCQMQHIDYNTQLNIKREIVEENIKRIGKLNVDVKPVIGMEDPYNYRNKVQLPIGRDDKGNVIIGFYKSKSHSIINMSECFIQDKLSNELIHIVKQWMEKYNISNYNEATGKGLMRHIMFRQGKKTGEIMVVIVTNEEKLPKKQELIDELVENIKGIKSIIHNINNKKTNVILGLKCNTLWGQDFITDYIGEFKFNISPLSFFQVNPIQTEKLYNKVMEFASLKGNETVFDAYCGTGTISLFLSKKCKKVYGIEIIKDAIDNAKINAKINNVNNADFILGKSEEIMPQLIDKGINPDVVVVDPPRKGCDKKLLETLCKTNPEKIVYVSCNPSTLARDLNVLCNNGFEVVEVQPVDMFPQTGHVETVVKIRRKDTL